MKNNLTKKLQNLKANLSIPFQARKAIETHKYLSYKKIAEATAALSYSSTMSL